MGDPVIPASKSAAWFEGRAHHIAPGGERPTTSRHSAIRVSREASSNPSKSNHMLYSVPISRTEQCPTLFGDTNRQACGRRDVQWKVKSYSSIFTKLWFEETVGTNKTLFCRISSGRDLA